VTLFEGTARDGVPHFPAKRQHRAVLSLAGVGFERTRLKVWRSALRFNTHSITIRGKTGTMSLRFESVPRRTIPRRRCSPATARSPRSGSSTRRCGTDLGVAPSRGTASA